MPGRWCYLRGVVQSELARRFASALRRWLRCAWRQTAFWSRLGSAAGRLASMRLVSRVLAVVCTSHLLSSTVPQRAQHLSASPPEHSALISDCAVLYDPADRTLGVFRTVEDCLRRRDPEVWREVISVAVPQCLLPVNSTERLHCRENGPDSSYMPPCVTTHDGLPAGPVPQHHSTSSHLLARRRGLTWHMSFFSGLRCDVDAPSLVVRGRLYECEECEVDASGGGSSHRHAHAFNSLVADGITPADELTVVREGSPVHEAARRDAQQSSASENGSSGARVDGGSVAPSSPIDSDTASSSPADSDDDPMATRLLALVFLVLLLVMVVLVHKIPCQACQWCRFGLCGCRTDEFRGGAAGQQRGWQGVNQEDSASDKSSVGFASAEKRWELEDII